MIYKLSAILVMTSLGIFLAMTLANSHLPSIYGIIFDITKSKAWTVSFVGFFALFLSIMPFLATTGMFLRTGKYLYTEIEELEFRFNIFVKTSVLHYSAMLFLHTVLTFMLLNYDEITLMEVTPFMKQISYCSGIYTMMVTLMSTALKIPLCAYLVEFGIMYDTGVPIKKVFRKSQLSFYVNLTLFVFSFVFELRMDRLFSTYIFTHYSKHVIQLDTLTDTTYSIIMFSCFYSAILNYYMVW